MLSHVLVTTISLELVKLEVAMVTNLLVKEDGDTLRNWFSNLISAYFSRVIDRSS